MEADTTLITQTHTRDPGFYAGNPPVICLLLGRSPESSPGLDPCCRLRSKLPSTQPCMSRKPQPSHPSPIRPPTTPPRIVMMMWKAPCPPHLHVISAHADEGGAVCPPSSVELVRFHDGLHRATQVTNMSRLRGQQRTSDSSWLLFSLFSYSFVLSIRSFPWISSHSFLASQFLRRSLHTHTP